MWTDRSVRRTRVLHVIQNLNYGGMESLLADLVRGVNRAKIESHILVLQYRGRFSQGLEEAATVHQAKAMSRWSMLLPKKLAAHIDALRPDVVHSHSGVWYKASLAARMAGVRHVIHTEHGRWAPDPLLARLLDGKASRRTDVVVAVSSSVADALRRRVVAPGCRVDVILNGVDTNRFLPAARDARLHRELGVGDNATIIGSIGRLEPIKGYDVMIDAFQSLRRHAGTEEAILVLAGDGSQRKTLQARAVAYGLERRVRFLGWRNDLDKLLQSFDCFTMSSHSEGTSISLLEAMSTAVCPVVTDVGGNRAVLGSALSHRLVPASRPDELADAWADIIRDRQRRESDGQAARARVATEYSLERMVAAYERLYTHESVRESNATAAESRNRSASPV